ncbi:High mobility group B protein 3 [Abeliophyllum distichum]|uniref:High mobility group B protein 3 n=1 Tax=Abeliophyllum distichum TaxID=126358 RepID=A0ABD1SG68_9LAMI
MDFQPMNQRVHGLKTWQREFEIPPKPGLQFFLSNTFSLSLDERGSAMKGGRSKAETRKADSKLSVKKGAAAAGKKAAPKGKPAKDPNKPKRPASAFFVFMEDFRKQYKEKHPNNKSVAAVGKAGGDKWKSLTDAEKAPYVAKAEKRKVEYEKTLQDYNKKMSEGAAAEEEESDKSRSEVNDEDDDEDGSGEEDDDDEE